jgi:hypothetical protein
MFQSPAENTCSTSRSSSVIDPNEIEDLLGPAIHDLTQLEEEEREPEAESEREKTKKRKLSQECDKEEDKNEDS